MRFLRCLRCVVLDFDLVHWSDLYIRHILSDDSYQRINAGLMRSICIYRARLLLPYDMTIMFKIDAAMSHRV